MNPLPAILLALETARNAVPVLVSMFKLVPLDIRDWLFDQVEKKNSDDPIIMAIMAEVRLKTNTPDDDEDQEKPR